MIKNTETKSYTEEQFHTLSENSPIGIGWTTVEGKVLVTNPAILHMTGYSDREVLHLTGYSDEEIVTLDTVNDLYDEADQG